MTLFFASFHWSSWVKIQIITLHIASWLPAALSIESMHWFCFSLVSCEAARQSRPQLNLHLSLIWMLQVALIKSCCLASVLSFQCSICGPKFPWKKIETSFPLNARSLACMLNTSIKTKRPAKNSSVAHSTRCKMISKSWMSARTKSQSAPKIAIQPEREQETPSDISLYSRKTCSYT